MTLSVVVKSNHEEKEREKQQQQKEYDSNNNDSSYDVVTTVSVQRIGCKCPFGNIEPIVFSITKDSCVWIQGPSGRGKTTIAMSIAGLSNSTTTTTTATATTTNNTNASTISIQNELDMSIQIQWNNTIPVNERCGVVFQQTTLLDELTVGGNLYIALRKQQQEQQKQQQNSTSSTKHGSIEKQIKQLLDMVGLDYNRDVNKHISQLSGGMSRRVSLAVQLAQSKHLIILDEPFTGLDHDTAISIAKELVHIRNTIGTSFVLITHQYDIAQYLINNENNNNNNNIIIKLEPPPSMSDSDDNDDDDNNTDTVSSIRPKPLNIYGTMFIHRLLDRFIDYTMYSLPLIVLTFIATGLAISMLSADSLRRIDVTRYILDIVDKEVPPLIQLLTGAEPSPLAMLGIRIKINTMISQTIPPAKLKLFCIGYTKLIVLEVGPLLTGLLLTGRIGGSYSGMISSMHSTQQMLLLQTLTISSFQWTLYPSLLAAVVASPLVTIIGTIVALIVGSIIAPHYNLGTSTVYWTNVYDTIFPSIRILPSSSSSSSNTMTLYEKIIYYCIEFGTWPPIFHILKSITFIFVTIVVSELCCYWSMYHPLSIILNKLNLQQQHKKQQQQQRRTQLTIRNIPNVITSSVVTSGLFIIILDWGFSQFWLLRQ